MNLKNRKYHQHHIRSYLSDFVSLSPLKSFSRETFENDGAGFQYSLKLGVPSSCSQKYWRQLISCQSRMANG